MIWEYDISITTYLKQQAEHILKLNACRCGMIQKV